MWFYLEAGARRLVQVQVADGVLETGLASSLRDGLGDWVHVELGHLRVFVQTRAGARLLPNLLLDLLRGTERRKRGNRVRTGLNQKRNGTEAGRKTDTLLMRSGPYLCPF